MSPGKKRKKKAKKQKKKAKKAKPKAKSKATAKAKTQRASKPVRSDAAPVRRRSNKITTSSTAEYFSKNLQQVGFSSQTKAVLTTLKESVDNALDACDDNGILPEIWIYVDKKGAGSLRNSDQIRIKVVDNGPGIDEEDIGRVFGEYLASSKFGRGRCSRGQQGIGISAATTWAQMTTATGVSVITKTPKMRKALSCTVEVDIRDNQGLVRERKMIDWKLKHGTAVEFLIDGRSQINGEGGLLNYILGNVLVNPHLTLHYRLPGYEKMQTIKRVSTHMPIIPAATDPHPHTMKLGEFISHSHLFGKVPTKTWLRRGFSRVADNTFKDLVNEQKLDRAILNKPVNALGDADFKALYKALQKIALRAPSTNSVLAIGEEGLAKSIGRLGEIDFFSVVSRKPAICDFKPVQVEVAVARLTNTTGEGDVPVQVLRFANRVPLQFDKAGCAIVHAINAVNWRSYGLDQPKKSTPLGPYIIAVSVVSPFIKFKNASKETIDSSEELVEEIRRALMQAGQRLSRHIKREKKANELEERIQYIEKFGPILVDGLCRITGASPKRKKKAEAGLMKLLGRDTRETKKELKKAEENLGVQLAKERERIGVTLSDATAPNSTGNGKEIVEETKSAKGKGKKHPKEASV